MPSRWPAMRPPLSAPTGTTVRLRGKRVLITGASSGIGEAGAELFAQKGAEVIIVARRADLLQEVADRITADGGTATAVPCDLSDLDAVDALRRHASATSTSWSTTPAARSAGRWPSRWTAGMTSSGPWC